MGINSAEKASAICGYDWEFGSSWNPGRLHAWAPTLPGGVGVGARGLCPSVPLRLRGRVCGGPRVCRLEWEYRRRPPCITPCAFWRPALTFTPVPAVVRAALSPCTFSPSQLFGVSVPESQVASFTLLTFLCAHWEGGPCVPSAWWVGVWSSGCLLREQAAGLAAWKQAAP